MSVKAAPQMPKEDLARYRAMVAKVPEAELKGASLPYTSCNGNMYSFLDKNGVCALRLSKADREAFLSERGAELYLHESGTVMQEYVPLPPSILADAKAAAGWLKKALAYARTLKPKATTRKKTAA